MTDSNNPELQSDEQAYVDKASADASPDNAALMRRRNLLKTGIVAVPAVMTLHNGAARANGSYDCEVVEDETPNGSCWTSIMPDWPVIALPAAEKSKKSKNPNFN